MPRGKNDAEMSAADRMRAHAAAVFKIPAGEQFIGAIQSVVSIALEDLARWMDLQDPPPGRQTTWCINCYRPFEGLACRYYYGANDVGPFCEACDQTIKETR